MVSFVLFTHFCLRACPHVPFLGKLFACYLRVTYNSIVGVNDLSELRSTCVLFSSRPYQICVLPLLEPRHTLVDVYYYLKLNCIHLPIHTHMQGKTQQNPMKHVKSYVIHCKKSKSSHHIFKINSIDRYVMKVIIYQT